MFYAMCVCVHACTPIVFVHIYINKGTCTKDVVFIIFLYPPCLAPSESPSESPTASPTESSSAGAQGGGLGFQEEGNGCLCAALPNIVGKGKCKSGRMCCGPTAVC